MFKMSLCFVVLLFLGTLIFLFGMILSKKSFIDLLKLSPFECGFSSRLNSRMPFSLQFFLVALVFVIFDVELILMFPMVYSQYFFYNVYCFMIFMLFLVLLTMGLLLEWKQNVLNWVL